MKNKWLVIGVIAIVLGIAGVIAIGAFAFAQRPFSPVAGVVGQGWNMMGQGYGMLAPGSVIGRGGMMGPGSVMGQGGRMGYGGLRTFGGQQNSLTEIAAKDLNLTVNDLITELQKGKTIADVAKEKGVSTDKIVDEYVAANTQTLKAAVDSKQLTQVQADAMLTLIKANAAAALTRTTTVGGFGFGMMGQNWNGAAPYGQNYPMMGGRGGWRR